MPAASEPGPGLAEQLAPDDVLVERGPDPARDLIGGGVLDEGEDHPAGDAEARALDPGGGELLLDHELLHRGRVAPPGPGPVRHRVAGLDQRLRPGGALQRGQPLDVRPDRRPDRLGLGGQVDRGRPANALPHQAGDVGRGLLGVHHRGDRGRPPQVQVRVVLPGEPDPAVHLDVEAGVARRGRDRERRRDRRGVAELIVVSVGARSAASAARPASQVAAVASSAATSMLAQWCLTAWKVAIGRPNWTRTLAYSAACWVVSVGDPDRLGREHGPGGVGQQRARAREQHGGRRVEPHPGRAAALVEVGGHRDRDPARRPLHQRDVVADRDQQHVGQVAADHDAGVPGDGAGGERDVTAEGDRADHGAVREAGQQPLRQPGCRGAGRHRAGLQGAGEHGARDHRRHVRARCQLPPHLLGHHQRLRQPEPGAAMVGRDVQPEQAKAR